MRITMILNKRGKYTSLGLCMLSHIRYGRSYPCKAVFPGGLIMTEEQTMAEGRNVSLATGVQEYGSAGGTLYRPCGYSSYYK